MRFLSEEELAHLDAAQVYGQVHVSQAIAEIRMWRETARRLEKEECFVVMEDDKTGHCNGCGAVVVSNGKLIRGTAAHYPDCPWRPVLEFVQGEK